MILQGSLAIFLLTAMIFASLLLSSLLLQSVFALSSSAAAKVGSSNMHVSSSNKAVYTSQLPLPIISIPPRIISQITDGQALSSSSSSSGFGDIINFNSNNLGNRIEDLNLPPGDLGLANTTITCRPSIPCIGTNESDIIMAGISEQVFGLKGNDIIFGADDDQLYGDNGNDIILSGGGNSLADGGSGDDVLTGGIRHTLLVGGPGNDKIFAGPGDTVMSGGSGANHFDCPQSIAGQARSIVLDYNPSNGDTIAGKCTLVNNVSPSGNEGGEGAAVPQTLPDTGDSSSSSDSSSGSEAIVASRSAGSG